FGEYGVPHLAFATFQGMFAVITAALISGAYAERMAFPAFALFTLLWSTFVYAPLAHWVWGGGWLAKMGALDFAGGTVVHISSGVSALVAALLVGPRAGYPERVSRPHNIPFTVVGASLLWFGWFGFNAGSALTSGALAAWAFTVTNTAAAAAGLTWAALEWARRGAPSLVGAASGAVAGLVAITPASGYVGIPASIAIGVGAGLLCYLAVNVLKPRLGYDDSLDVFGVHGVAGTWGAVATGLFASRAINPAAADGLLFGNPAQLGAQLASVGAAWVLAGVGTFVLLKVVAAVTPLRVAREQELAGLDVALHGEAAYEGQQEAVSRAGALPLAGSAAPAHAGPSPSS
ncbi:MAG TPA: ammonium transporter, partial [Limnochordales bacterium]